MTTFRAPKSGLDIAWSGVSVSNETHTIPQSSPYEIYLEYIPKIKSTGTSVLDNDYVSLADMRLGFTATIGGGAATLTDNQNPSAGEYYCQIIETNFDFSTKVRFNSADVGKAFVVSYTGYASNPSGIRIQRLQEAAVRLEDFPFLRMVSTNTYNSGYFDDGDADNKKVYLLPSGYHLSFSDDLYEWAGGWLDFDAAGNCEVAAFTNANYWKRIGIWLKVSGGSLVADSVESAEAANQGALTDPAAFSGEAFFLGYVDVQNDGTTGVAGKILAIANTKIDSQVVAGFSSTMQAQPIFEFTWEVDGSLIADTDVAGPWFPGFAGTIQSLSVICADTGSGGSNLVVDCEISGTSIYSVSGTKPTVTANSGTYQTDTSTDMGTTSFSNSDYLVVDLDTVPTASETVKITIRGVRS